jgi:hypothetical protein
MPKQMIDHLQIRGGALDFADTKKLIAERDTEWDVSENPQIYFNRVKKAVKALTRANINTDMNQHRDMALYHFKASGEFDAAVSKWENKAAVNKMWTNIKTIISAEYACKNKQNILTAKQFKANAMEEQAETTEELIAALTENHAKYLAFVTKPIHVYWLSDKSHYLAKVISPKFVCVGTSLPKVLCVSRAICGYDCGFYPGLVTCKGRDLNPLPYIGNQTRVFTFAR